MKEKLTDEEIKRKNLEGITCIRKLKAIGVLTLSEYHDLCVKLDEVYPYNPLWALRADTLTPKP